MKVLNLKKLAVASVVGVSAVAFFGMSQEAKAAPPCYNSNGNLPPIDCAYAASLHLKFPNGIDFSNPYHSDFKDIVFGDPPPTNIGDMQTESFNSLMDVVVSTSGQNNVLTNLPTAVMTKITLTGIRDIGNGKLEKTFSNEMLSLDIQGLPGGALFRESPTLASTGITTITEQDNGTFLIDSYFDIYADISLDNGQTWVASEGPGRVDAVGVTPEPSSSVPIALVGLGALWSLKKKASLNKE